MTNSRASSQVVIASVKQADQAKTTDTTAANDSELAVTLKANKAYHYQLTLFVIASANPDIKFNMAVPSGATIHTTAGTIIYNHTTALVADDATVSVTSITNGNAQSILAKGKIVMSSTPGDVTVQWAQATSHADSTTVKAGSSLIVYPDKQ